MATDNATSWALPAMPRPAASGESDGLAGGLQGLGRMFYMVEPAHTTFKTPEEVPFFFRQVSTSSSARPPFEV